ncbi:MAG TPA: sulfotransferase [Steroidobacteraceae bacterium]|nr:sulfotransferase [Steroidobacteraceae bacterium]
MNDTLSPFHMMSERAWAALRAGEILIAERELRQMRAAQPGERTSLHLLGVLLLAQGKIPAAVESLERVIDDEPEFVHARRDLARAYRAAGRAAAALEEVRKVLRAAPSLAPAWLTLGDILVDLGKFQPAASAFRLAQSLDPNRSRVTSAWDACRAGDCSDAERLFKELLHEDASHPGVLCGLAAAYMSDGRVQEAECLLRHALVQTAHAPSVWRLLGQVYLEQSRLAEAETAIQRCLKIEPRDAQSWVALACTCSRLMRPEAALAAYQRAECIDPKLKLVHLSIGHLFKALGRRTACERVYHECIAQEPGEAYWSLADLKDYAFSAAEIASMEALAAAPGDEHNAALLHFSLGRAYEQKDHAKRAFSHYAMANRLRRAQKPFDYDAFDLKCRRLIASLDRDFFAANQGSGDPDDSPIFIVGLPRSGSTLIEQIIASHSRVEGTMELPNILNYVRELEHLDSQADAYPESLRSAPRVVLEALGRRYLAETRPLRTGRARFIDKLPNNFSHIGLIHAILPNATIVDVRRHPMDACFSCFKQYFASGQSFSYDLSGLGRYYRQYLAVMDHWDAVLPGKVLHLSYEDLIRAPEKVIRRLLAHCGLPFEDACLRFHETRRAVRTASSEQVRKPLYASGVGHWRRFEHELEPLRQSLGDCLARFPAFDPSFGAPGAHRTPMRRLRRARPPLPAAAPRAALSLAVAAVLYAGFEPPTAVAEATDEALREIVVTARKRTENVQDVPQDIEVFTSQDLKNLGIVRFEDWAALAPSISMISTGPGGQRIFIRGVSDGSTPNFGFSNLSTTGFLIDDLSFSYYGHVPDLHLYDIERIEVLNGPQGTLFGPGALSGAVRIITKKPDPNGFSAGVDLDGGKIEGGTNNWTYEGYANIPLIEGRTALRLSAYGVRDGGYIDNLLATRTWLNGVTSSNAAWAGRNENVRDTLGGRIALLHNISEAWRLTLTGYYQQQKYRGSWDDDPANVAPRALRRFSPSGGYDYGRFLELRSDGDVGIGDLIYVGGYSVQRKRRLYDFSEYAQYSGYASFIQSTTCVTDPSRGPGDHGCQAPYMYGDVEGEIKRTSNELRLQSKATGPLHWTVGAYWEKTQDPYSGNEHLPNINFNGGPAQQAIADYGNMATPVAGQFYSSFATSDYLETSEFADITVDLGPRWSVEAGVEHFHSSGTDAIDFAENFYVPRTSRHDVFSSHRTNFKAGLDFKPNPHALLYVAFAQGFRDGGINYLPAGSAADIPGSFAPDTLNNYELGWKTDGFNDRLVWDSAAYYMLWSGYQVGVSIPVAPFGFNANVGDARIIGVESSLEVRPLPGLNLSLSGNYNDARLRSNEFQNPSFVVLPGERLAEAPIFNFNAIARYERRLTPAALAFAQVDLAHKGSMWNDLRVDVRTLQPEYTLGNLRFGVSEPAGSWRAEGYVTNVANKRAVVYVDRTGYAYFPGHSTPEMATAPRTFGMHLSYHWGKST